MALYWYNHWKPGSHESTECMSETNPFDADKGRCNVLNKNQICEKHSWPVLFGSELQWVSECVTSVFNSTLINDTYSKYIRNRIVVGTYQDVFYFHSSTVEQNIVILCLLSLGLNKNVNVDAHWGWTVWSFIAHLSSTGPRSSLTTPDWVTWEHIISADKEDLDSKEYKL